MAFLIKYWADTADNIGNNAPFFLMKIRASVIVLRYNPII
jgi:hypothetical protein